MIVLTFMAVGILPLAAAIVVNLPSVLDYMESSIEREALLLLRESYGEISRKIERRNESVDLLADVPGLRDMTEGASESDNSKHPVVSRLLSLINGWFLDQKDVVDIVLYGLDGTELLKFVRDSTGVFISAGTGKRVNTGFAEEMKYVDFVAPGKNIILLKDQVSLEGKQFCHHPEFITASPVYNTSDQIAGFAAISTDVSTILGKFKYDYLITGTGKFMYEGQFCPSGATGSERDAFEVFPGLRNLIEKKMPGIVTDRRGRRSAWIPVINNNRLEHSVWVGRDVDLGAISTMQKVFAMRTAIVALFLVLAVFTVGLVLSAIADRYRRELVMMLRNILVSKNADGSLKLAWKVPVELKELADDINRLAEQYIEADTKRMEAIENMAELHHRMKLVLDNAAEGIIELDRDGEVRFANPSACRILGFTEDELAGHDFHSIVHYMRKGRSQLYTRDCPFCQVGKWGNWHVIMEDLFVSRDGEPVYVEYMTAPIRQDDGDVSGMVMCLRDVSNRKLAEKRADELRRQLIHAQKMEAVGTLAGGVAHDFNNLLTVVTGYCELIALEVKGNESVLQYADTIKDAAKRASALTHQLLTFSRKQVAEKSLVDVNKLVRDQKKMLARVIGENIRLETVFLDKNPLVNADSGMLSQVIMNLVINARDAMDDMTGTVMLTVSRQEIMSGEEEMYEYGRSGKFVMISVADTGSGIKEDDMQRIFEPFFTTKEEGKGSGLGLALVYGIIEQHDGWVNCYSEVGKGTVFKIYLPEYLSETGGGDEDDIDDEPMRGELKAGCRAFVVEDDLMVLEITREMLNSMGFQVVAATSYNEALTLLEGLEYSVDLVVSDVVLPDGSGISLVEYMKANAPEIPVILVSGYLDQKAHIDEISDLEVPFLSKPFNRDELVAMIRKVAKEKQ